MTQDTQTLAIPVMNRSMCTLPPELENVGTNTIKTEMYTEATETSDLIRYKSSAMETDKPLLRSSGTYTGTTFQPFTN